MNAVEPFFLMGEENDQQEVAAKMQEAVFAKVVWEEEGMVKIVRILTDSAKDIDEDAYRMFMERIERMAPLGNKCLVYKDDEGDEVSECVIVIERVSVVVFL